MRVILILLTELRRSFPGVSGFLPIKSETRCKKTRAIFEQLSEKSTVNAAQPVIAVRKNEKAPDTPEPSAWNVERD
jgi:hypothetical protein